MIVGIIGPSDSGFKIKDDLKQIDSDLKTKIYVREKVVDTIEVISKCEDECDAIIFTGCAVYEFIKSELAIADENKDIKIIDDILPIVKQIRDTWHEVYNQLKI